MKSYVSDTHALFWYLTASPRLGSQAKTAFAEAAAGQATILIPAIVLAELYYVNEKAGRPVSLAQETVKLRQAGQFVFLPFTADDVLDFDADAAVPEMHDRMIVGAARRSGAVCVTRDAQIVASGLVPTLW